MSRPNKRHRRGQTADSIEDVHKNRASREAEKNAERKQQAQAISRLLKDDKAIREEIEKLKEDKDKDHGSTIKALEVTLSKHQQDTQRRLTKQEQDSEIALKRRLAAGLIVGPAPPSTDPPLRGPGHPPPKPPPFRQLPVPPPPPRPIQPLLSNVQVQSLQQPSTTTGNEGSKLDLLEQTEVIAEIKPPPKKLFMPTSVAVNLNKKPS